MAGKAKSRSVSEAVAALADELGLDQIVVVGWEAEHEKYVMVAHGRDALEQSEANAFADRLMQGIVADAGKIERYGKKADKSRQRVRR